MDITNPDKSFILANAAVPVFAFYLLVACNYVKEVFGCTLQTLLETSIVAKHIVAFFLLFFLIILTNPQFAENNIGTNMLYCVGIYAWFIITARCPFYVMFVVLALLLASYIASTQRAKYSSKQEDRRKARIATIVQNSLAIAALGVSVIGATVYALQKRIEYGKSFSIPKFFIGTIECKRDTPEHAKQPPFTREAFSKL